MVGESRWLNAMAVVADENAIAKIQRLPFVKKLVIIQSDMNLCSRETEETMESGMAEAESFLTKDKIDPNVLHAQLKRMGGEDGGIGDIPAGIDDGKNGAVPFALPIIAVARHTGHTVHYGLP